MEWRIDEYGGPEQAKVEALRAIAELLLRLNENLVKLRDAINTKK